MTTERRSLITATRAQVAVPLREAVNQLLRRTLQIATVRLSHTEARAMRVNRLAVVLTITTLGHEPHRIAFINLSPIARHAHVHTTIEDRDALVTVRRIRNAPARRIIRIVVVVRIVAGLLTNRITLPAASDLRHRWRGAVTAQPLLNTRKLARIEIG